MIKPAGVMLTLPEYSAVIVTYPFLSLLLLEQNSLFSFSFCPDGGSATSPSEASKLSELQTTISSLREAADERERQLAELSARLEEAQQKHLCLQQEKDEAQEENAGLLQNYTRLQASVTELQTRVQEQEDKALQKVQLDHEIQVLTKNLAGRPS